MWYSAFLPACKYSSDRSAFSLCCIWQTRRLLLGLRQLKQLIGSLEPHCGGADGLTEGAPSLHAALLLTASCKRPRLVLALLLVIVARCQLYGTADQCSKFHRQSSCVRAIYIGCNDQCSWSSIYSTYLQFRRFF